MLQHDEDVRWSADAVGRLRALAVGNVPAELISEALGRPINEVIAKAAALQLPLRAVQRLDSRVD